VFRAKIGFDNTASLALFGGDRPTGRHRHGVSCAVQLEPLCPTDTASPMPFNFSRFVRPTRLSPVLLNLSRFVPETTGGVLVIAT